tara:strand:- start:3102 stop:3812 length:711 start_codon:yes stop_codon:yes gene_type:complete
MKIIILIAVYNEKRNITNLFIKIRKFCKYDILYINDNSNDGTTEEINKLKKKYKNIYHINRINKFGIGSAHKDGIKWCYRKKYKLIVTMDGDGTHNPKYINSLIKKNMYSDITISNRFLKKNSLKTWPFLRVIITNIRHILISLLLGIHYDASGAFRCINTDKVKLKNITSVEENDYSFFWKSIYFLNQKYKINEIPISLPSRELGYSKMKIKHIIYSLLTLLIFFFKEKIIKKIF